MKTLTVFTCTYNRKKLLSRLFESLKNQTSKDFEWLIVDDGSTDGTESQVKCWQENCDDIDIKYFYKTNDGLHTGYNLAIKNANSDICVCIDSDDFMPDDAVEKIVDFWNKNKSNEVGGFIGLNYNVNTKTFNTPKFENTDSVRPIDLLCENNSLKRGDRKFVVKTSLYKEVSPMRIFEGEKYFNPHYMILQISKEYKFLVSNDVYCNVDYQKDGMSANIWKQYYNSPKSFAETRKMYLSFDNLPFVFKVKNCIHYVSSCILAHKKIFEKGTKEKFLTFLCLPLGFAFSLLVKYKNKVK